MHTSLAPIVLFVYNRPWHVQQTVASLRQCTLAEESHLYIFSDGPKNQSDTAKVAEVRKYIQRIEGFAKVEIREQSENRGLASSVIEGVSSVIQVHKKAIVLEDDLIFTPNFLAFMNDALSFYQQHPNIFSISGYVYPITIPPTFKEDILLLPRASSWGWATWLDRWEKADWQLLDYDQFIESKSSQKEFTAGGEDLLFMLIKQKKGLIDSWAIRWAYSHFKHQAFGLFPVKSKVQNIGNDNSGTHSSRTSQYQVELGGEGYRLSAQPTLHDQTISNLQTFFKPSLIRRIINYLTLHESR